MPLQHHRPESPELELREVKRWIKALALAANIGELVPEPSDGRRALIIDACRSPLRTESVRILEPYCEHLGPRRWPSPDTFARLAYVLERFEVIDRRHG